ncbi:molybdopterin cofactor-binding domain-containing protein [Rhizobium leguminosarum]|uniref:Isoquinoline 1-oxidoreductase n=2 Tax=Rhizobium leguminosarum TaxID=384 RepID=A0A154ICM4_RHILE|nr:xanthine dehydrogenase family protein molybdopterin-binding subunit [Rhizobium leguminosarum]KZA98171.1 isoquinoline 1-oxidoreductase [Rhizobium leguminosarum]
MPNIFPSADQLSETIPLNLSRRSFIGASLGAFVLGVALPARVARAQSAPKIVPGTRVPAFLEIRPDGTMLLKSPFIEGGQGIFTAMAQIVGEELDADPQHFVVETAPPGSDYLVLNGRRITGGSMSVRFSYTTMRKLGASARRMLIEAAAERLQVPLEELSTEPGRVVHAASSRSLDYGSLAREAATRSVPQDVELKNEENFRWIGKPVARLDVLAKSTGKATYSIDIKVDGMLHAAVQHAPRFGCEPDRILNEDQVRAMPGIHSLHRLPGAVAVVAQRWWHAKRAAETLQVVWSEPAPGTAKAMPKDFSEAAFRETLLASPGPGIEAEKIGDAQSVLRGAQNVIRATYDAPYLIHGQLEPSSSLARFNPDGTLEIWAPNQAPEAFQAAAAKLAGLPPEKVMIHSPMLGGFFGRHFLYPSGGNPFPQAVLLAKATGHPVKVIWTREEEFLRDYTRPMGLVRFTAALDGQGLPLALEAEFIGDGPNDSLRGRTAGKADSNAVEGIVAKAYAIPNKRVAQIQVAHTPPVGFWRSVGHSMNDFFYETFLDELADAGKQDPYQLRYRLLADSPRHRKLLEEVAELSGGWKRGPFIAGNGSRRARGIAMASPFGSETATIAEVSLNSGKVVVHDVWVAIDPGSIVNPAIVEAQVNSAVALGVSATLHEEMTYVDGLPKARNYDLYPILSLAEMPRVHVRIIESGAPMGGIGEPGLPGVPPSVANAVATLTGHRVRSLPLAKVNFEA